LFVRSPFVSPILSRHIKIFFSPSSLTFVNHFLSLSPSPHSPYYFSVPFVFSIVIYLSPLLTTTQCNIDFPMVLRGFPNSVRNSTPVCM
jgi:hypothetical protein